jgi:hypothetical protein
MKSLGPPAGTGTSMRKGFVGKPAGVGVCAVAATWQVRAAMAATQSIRWRIESSGRQT